MTIGRAMGAALEQQNRALQEAHESEGSEKRADIRFVLELYPRQSKVLSLCMTTEPREDCFYAMSKGQEV
jgi:hypothetical protein